MIRILLVDDQKSIRERLKLLLEDEPDFNIVGMVDNGYDAIEQVKLLLPDVVLMDMEMPDIDGALATKIIAHSSIETKVLVLTSYDSHEYVAKSIYAGAKGYILKGAPAEEIREAIRFVNLGYMQIAPGLFEKFMPERYDPGLLELKSRHLDAAISKISHDRLVGAATRTDPRAGKLELSGLGEIEGQNRSAMGSALDLDQPSELILDITALHPRRKSLGWYQAVALVLAGLGLTGSLFFLRQGLKKPAPPPDRQQSGRLHDLPFTGKIEPVRIAKVDTINPGIVSAVAVSIGQTVKTGDRLLTIRNIDAELTNQFKLRQQQQIFETQKQATRQQAAQQRQQLAQQQQILIGEQQAAAGRVSTIQLAITNYQRNIVPLRQQVAAANIQLNIATPPEQLPLRQKREAIARANTIYERTWATYQRLAQYQSEGAISQERVEQAEKEMTIAQSDLHIAQSDYDSAIESERAAVTKQAAQTQATRLQQQLTLKEQAGQLQQLQAQLQVAQSDYQQIGTRLKQLQQQQQALINPPLPTSQAPVLEPTIIEIVAPLAGIVLELPISQGDRVFTGNKLLGIANTKQLKIGVELDSQQAVLLKSGQRAVVKIGTEIDTQESIGLITKIAPPLAGNENRSSQRIEVEFPNPKSTLPIGQVGTVYFPNP
jgi:hemolysin D